MNTENVRSTAEELKGKAKEAFGDVTDDARLKAEGEAEEAHAKAEKDVEEAADELNKASAAETQLEAEKYTLEGE